MSDLDAVGRLITELEQEAHVAQLRYDLDQAKEIIKEIKAGRYYCVKVYPFERNMSFAYKLLEIAWVRGVNGLVYLRLLLHGNNSEGECLFSIADMNEYGYLSEGGIYFCTTLSSSGDLEEMLPEQEVYRVEFYQSFPATTE